MVNWRVQLRSKKEMLACQPQPSLDTCKGMYRLPQTAPPKPLLAFLSPASPCHIASKPPSSLSLAQTYILFLLPDHNEKYTKTG